MIISPQYFFRFWLNNTALAVGFIFLSIFLPPFLWIFMALSAIHPAIYPVGFFIILQQVVLRHFFGDLRGYFEFAALAWDIEKKSNIAIKNAYGPFFLFKLKIDEMGTFGLFRDDIYKNILANESLMSASNIALSIHIRAARSYSKEGDSNKALTHLQQAINLFPNNIVANYLMGSCKEKMGDGAGAIHAYETALEYGPEISANISVIFSKRINKVKKHGPAKRASMPGLKFVMY